MNLFDLLFLAVLAACLISLLAAVTLLFQKRFARARRVLARLVACAAAYMAVVIVVSAVLPRDTVEPGGTRCFDDWCIGVAAVDRIPRAADVEYRVDFRLSSRALRVAQREKNLAVYLTDESGRRYAAESSARATPFSVLLQPRESVLVSRSFLVPSGAREIALVMVHEGGFPIGWFIIGYSTWFRKPPLVRLR